jgi:hypothetical protein
MTSLYFMKNLISPLLLASMYKKQEMSPRAGGSASLQAVAEFAVPDWVI